MRFLWLEQYAAFVILDNAFATSATTASAILPPASLNSASIGTAMICARKSSKRRFHKGMRIGNLSALHLERHLRPFGSGRTRQIHIHIPAEEVKNNKALDYLLPTNVAALLDLYLTKARPVLEGQQSDYLFPKQKGGPKPSSHLSELIKDTILEHTGLVINAHLFRSIAGKIHSLVQPGDFVTLSHVLNNSLGTSMKSYAQFERQSSLQHYQNSLQAARRGGAT